MRDTPLQIFVYSFLHKKGWYEYQTFVQVVKASEKRSNVCKPNPLLSGKRSISKYTRRAS